MSGVASVNQAVSFRVLSNPLGRHALWPAYKAVPVGWRQVFAPASEEECLEYIRRHWTTLCSRAHPVLQVHTPGPERTSPPLAFGLLFFGGDEGDSAAAKYQLVIDAARYADVNGFAAVWLPERHFTAMGSLYPNPAVLHAALARETRRIRLRAGSVVLPLHDPIRVAEEWALVDNLSGGRVELSFAPGWNAEDFALRPDHYHDRYEQMYQGVEVVRTLWTGQTVERTDGTGRVIRVRTYPSPVQPRLPTWITAAGSLRSFQQAGRIGADVLTHLFDQGVEELGEKVVAYRRARAECGWDPESGRVAVTLHTYLADDPVELRDNAFRPFFHYLKGNLKLLGKLAQSRDTPIDLERLPPDQVDEAIGYLFEKYLRQRSLMGSLDDGVALVTRLATIGVQEVACLLDFGPPPPAILGCLPRIRALMERVATATGSRSPVGITLGERGVR